MYEETGNNNFSREKLKITLWRAGEKGKEFVLPLAPLHSQVSWAMMSPRKT